MSRLTGQEIGERIRRWRERRSMTQVELARQVGVAQVTISTIELATRDLRVTTALDIATALRVNLQTLITKDPS